MIRKAREDEGMKNPKAQIEDMELVRKVINGMVDNMHTLTADIGLSGNVNAQLLRAIRIYRAKCVAHILKGGVTMG
jgi:hypothetical protein